jgi:hypothetical protein
VKEQDRFRGECHDLRPPLLSDRGAGHAARALASYRVKRTFRELSEVGIRSHMSGAEVAHAMLRASGVCGVRVEPHQGFLSDPL